MGMSAEAAGWVLPKVLLVCTHLAPRWIVFVHSGVVTSAWATRVCGAIMAAAAPTT